MEQQELLELRKNIDKAKGKSSELKGQLKGLTKELKEDWDCDTLKQAETKVQKMEIEVIGLDEKIKKSVTELEEKYDV